jgi:hypothetical protein
MTAKPAIEDLATGKGNPYETSIRIWKLSMNHAAENNSVSHALWLIFGRFTDRWEEEENNRQEIESDMKSFSKEFLRVSEPEREEFLKHWIYDKLGYQEDEPEQVAGGDATR